MTEAPLNEDDVALLTHADARVRAANKALEHAKAARDKIRSDLAAAVPYDEPQRAGQLEVLRRRKSTGERLDFTGYRKRYPLSKRLAGFLVESFYDEWQIRPYVPSDAAG